jgi:hypothetical protein
MSRWRGRRMTWGAGGASLCVGCLCLHLQRKSPDVIPKDREFL